MPSSSLFHAVVMMGVAMGCAKHHVVEGAPVIDAGRDAGTDAGIDAGLDAGQDVGTDADAGPCADDCDPCGDGRTECVGCEFMPCIL